MNDAGGVQMVRLIMLGICYFLAEFSLSFEFKKVFISLLPEEVNLIYWNLVKWKIASWEASLGCCLEWNNESNEANNNLRSNLVSTKQRQQ